MAIRAIAWWSFLSPSISRRVIESYLGSTRARPGHLDPLTSRQREILQLVAEGKTTKEVAFQLSLSVKTVEAHRLQLMNKIGILAPPRARALRHAHRPRPSGRPFRHRVFSAAV